jgi:predicted transcriptional regulator
MPGLSTNTITNTSSTVRELLIYLYDLSPLDVDVFFILMKSNKPMKLEDLIKKIQRDKTNIFRSLQRLVSLGLCIKEVRTLQNGGYYHIYTTIDVKACKAEAQKRVNELQASLFRILRKFENEIEKIMESMPQ